MLGKYFSIIVWVIFCIASAQAQQGVDGNQAFKVRSFRLTGFNSPQIEPIESAFQSSLAGRTLTKSDLVNIEREVTSKLRSQGYLIGQAVLTPDDRSKLIKSGELQLTIFPGRVSAIEIQNTSNVNSDWVYEVAKDTLCPQGFGNNCVLTKENFERMTQLLGDTAGLQLGVVDFNPDGAPLGQTNITILALPKDSQFKGSIGVDNQGFNSSGKYRLGVTGIANNLFGVGDSVAINLFDTNKGSVSGSVDVSGPLASNGLRWQSSVSRSQYYVPGVSSTGFGNSLSAGLAYPLVRSLDVNWIAALNAVGVVTNSQVIGITTTDKTLKSVQAVLDGNSGDRSINLGQNAWYMHSALSSGSVSDHVAQTNEPLGPYTKLALSGIAKTVLNDERNIYSILNVRGQVANTNLDPYEKLLVGGYSGVRAYSLEEGSFNNGAIATLELRQAFNTEWGRLTPGIFVDYANGWINHATYSGWNNNTGYTNHQVLADYGIGIDWSDVQGFVVSLSWANRFGSSPPAIAGTGSANSQFWFVVQSRF